VGRDWVSRFGASVALTGEIRTAFREGLAVQRVAGLVDRQQEGTTVLMHYRWGRDPDHSRRTTLKVRPILWLLVLVVMPLSVPAMASPLGASPFVDSTFDVIAHGNDANVGDFSVFVNAEEVDDGWNIQVSAEGGISCYWEGVAGDHFTETSGELGVQTDDPASSDDCNGAFMHVFVVAEFATTESVGRSILRDNGQICVGTEAEAHYFVATVVVTHDDFAEPVEIVTTDTHYSTIVEGFCHATG
jgi:hypothetical protein